jgi:hypothetical protein
MKRTLLIVLILMAFVANAMGDVKHYNCVVTINKRKASIGDIVSVSIKISGQKITAISWNMYDRAFYAADDVKITTSRSSDKNTTTFEHLITFTSVKAGKLHIGSFPVFIEDGQVETAVIKAFDVTFMPFIPVSSINDLQPPVSMVAYYAYALVFLLVISAIIIAQVSFNRFIIKQNTGIVSINRVRKLSLKKLATIAQPGSTNAIANTAMADTVFIVLKNFIDHVAYVYEAAGGQAYPQNMVAVRNMEVINELMDTSAKLRFNEFYCTPDRLHSYLNNVKLFIANFQFNDSL